MFFYDQKNIRADRVVQFFFFKHFVHFYNGCNMFAFLKLRIHVYKCLKKKCINKHVQAYTPYDIGINFTLI